MKNQHDNFDVIVIGAGPTGWVIVEVDDKAQARGILPPLYRDSARIVQLNRFTLEELDALLEHHQD